MNWKEYGSRHCLIYGTINLPSAPTEYQEKSQLGQSISRQKFLSRGLSNTKQE
jgi:hypothetical protein